MISKLLLIQVRLKKDTNFKAPIIICLLFGEQIVLFYYNILYILFHINYLIKIFPSNMEIQNYQSVIKISSNAQTTIIRKKRL